MSDPVIAVEASKAAGPPRSVEALMQKLGTRVDEVETTWRQSLQRADKTGRELVTVPGLAEYRENMLLNVQNPLRRKVLQAQWLEEDRTRKLTAEMLDSGTKFSVVKSHLEIGISVISSLKKGFNQLLSAQ